MSTQGLLSLLAGVVVLGGSLGGAFAGGVALGKSDGDSSSAISALTPAFAGSRQQFSGGRDGDDSPFFNN